MKSDPMLGVMVEIRSVAGIAYYGVVRSVRDAGELGEIFELGSETNEQYQRFIHVVDRLVQIQEID